MNITGGSPDGEPAGQPAGVSSDEIVESGQVLEEAMDELIEDSFDSTPPAPRSNLRIAGQSGCLVTLEWDPSKDDEGMSAYRVYSNGSFEGMVDEQSTKLEVSLFP